MPTQYLPAILAFFVCAGILPAVRAIATHFNLYDQPGPIKIHRQRVPRLGGIAMMGGMLAAIAPFLPSATKSYAMAILIFLGVWLVGLIDDVKNLPSRLRLCAHLAAGASLWFCGWQPQLFRNSFLDLAATSLFVAFLINAMNLLDGMDGLAAGTAAIVTAGFMITSAGAPNAARFVVASGLLGACGGMLIMNAPPATMFMGDSGSTLLGIVLAFLSLNWMGSRPHAEHNFAMPLIFLSIPLADAALAIIRRARTHKSLLAGDRRHYYDLLLQRGWTVRGVLSVSLIATICLVCIGLLSSRGGLGQALAASAVTAALIAAAQFLGSIESASEIQPSRQESSLGAAFEPVKSTPISSGDGHVIL